jgi:DNA methylase
VPAGEREGAEHHRRAALNAVCPYYTMYPLEFPSRVLRRNAAPGEWVLDPFCGRGTTLYAARLLGLPSVGIDSSAVAAAVAAAKLSTSTPGRVIAVARAILCERDDEAEVPTGTFWRWAYHRTTLAGLCRLRQELLRSCSSPSLLILRAILLGALHGPVMKGEASYFSNQCTRTFAPKPGYAVRYWQERSLRPPEVDLLAVIERRAARFLASLPARTEGEVVQADSRTPTAIPTGRQFSWVITSPPYYGMRTYVPDQWLRNWFLGGPGEVAYTYDDQLRHTSPEEFSSQLALVWRNVAAHCRPQARLVVRFGGINDRKQDPQGILRDSLARSGWRVLTARPAGSASSGKRQAEHFARRQTKPVEERDVYAELEA